MIILRGHRLHFLDCDVVLSLENSLAKNAAPGEGIECALTNRQSTCLLVFRIHRGSYMSAHVLLNLPKDLEKRDKIRGLSSILPLFRNEFNKSNNTRARMLDSILNYKRNPSVTF